MNKTSLVFISHSSEDRKSVQPLVQLLKDMGITPNSIFCSSIPGYDIGLGGDIFETLYKTFEEYNLYVIFVHSHNFYKSTTCQNEMGAVWARGIKFCSILLPGFDFSEMQGVVKSNKISLKVDADRQEVQNWLNQLYDDLASFFEISRNTGIVWENARNSFIDAINNKPVVKTNENDLSETAKTILLEAAKDERGEVKFSRSMQGTRVFAGGCRINKSWDRREEAKVIASVDELIQKEYLEQSDLIGDVYQLTHVAYRYLDENLE